MKTHKMLAFIGMAMGLSFFLQCQHEDEEIKLAPPPAPAHGTETLSCTNCTPLVENGASSDFSSGAVPAGQWYFDKAHSNVTWETAYQGVGSLLTGRFNYFVLKNLSFDEQNPGNVSLEAYVRLNSVNTGEPGRDGGCLLNTYGTESAKTTEPENIATIKSTSAKYSDTDSDFLVTADFTFHGVTLPVTIRISYVPQTHFAAGYTIAGFVGQFEFNALSEYGIESTNISDKVVVKINGVLRKKD
jgi:polyisoprenoid-binding protein YceI